MSMADAFREEWTTWIDQFSLDNRELNASLVVIGSKGHINVVAQGVPFSGLSADWKDGENSVIISLDGMDHVVADVVELDLEETGQPPAVIRVKSGDGSTTIVHLS
jgi:hypothetical protein